MAIKANPKDLTIRAETTSVGAWRRGISSLTQIMVVDTLMIAQANSAEKSPETDMEADPTIVTSTPAPDQTFRPVILNTTAVITGSTKTVEATIVLPATPETKEGVEAAIATKEEDRHPENALARDLNSTHGHRQI